MQKSIDKVTFLVNNADILSKIYDVPPKEPFCDEIVSFLTALSKRVMGDAKAKRHSDVVTFGFWIRKSSLNSLKNRHQKNDGMFRLGKGVAFHVAPSNVPVNFAYSLIVGLLTGNANIVRVPSKEFEQVSIICNAINMTLAEYEDLKPYISLVRYERDKDINDLFSQMADVRIVWGGDATIAELRRSPLQPRATELVFADRYSLAVIDSDSYLAMDNKAKVAEDFYNDTYLSDQNACTSPRMIVWLGEQIDEAKKAFWQNEHRLVKDKYNFQAIQAVNKITRAYLVGTAVPAAKVEEHMDNLIIRIQVKEATVRLLMEYKDNGGFFFEYNCKDIMEIKELCDDKHCQTIGYIGDKAVFAPLLRSGIKGVDRIVPVGKTMDFDIDWDGYDLICMMTRIISIA